MSATDSFDLVVLGTGAGGSTPAAKCREAGWRVAVVDDQPYGGTCAVRGCDPKKVLVGASEVVDWHRRMQGHGVAGESYIDWPVLMRFKRSFTDAVPERHEQAFHKSGVETLHGHARFVTADRLIVGNRELDVKHVVIATGARPRPLGIPGEEHVSTSTDFLELDALPARIAFIGAGYISFEFAHLVQRAGAQAVVLGRGTPLGQFDQDLVATLIEHSRHVGIDVRLNTSVTSVERQSDTDAGARYRVHTDTNGHAGIVEADLVVHGGGRVPNTDTLDAALGDITLDARGGVAVNEYLQSVSNPRVYAAGDAVLPPGAIPLTPVASHEGAVIASNLLHGDRKRPDYRGIPSVVFTSPPLASVGLTEAEARRQGIEVHVQHGDTSSWYSNRRVRESVGMYKTIIEAKTDRLVGAHLLGTHVDELINLFAVAIRCALPATELRHMIYAYPTSMSDIPYML